MECSMFHRQHRPLEISSSCRLLVIGGLVAILLTCHARRASAQGAVGGVYIDPAGMLRETSGLAPADLRRRLEAGGDESPASLGVASASPLRKISLRRLEHLVAELHEQSQPVPADIRYLAGLTSVKYVFIDPDAADVVLAGPAEGWDVLPTGDIVGSESHRPVLQLDDLVVALRYAFAEGHYDRFLGSTEEQSVGERV